MTDVVSLSLEPDMLERGIISAVTVRDRPTEARIDTPRNGAMTVTTDWSGQYIVDTTARKRRARAMSADPTTRSAVLVFTSPTAPVMMVGA